MDLSMIIILTTFPSPEPARELAHSLISQKLAACIQLIPQVESIYSWEGEVRSDKESLLLIKTTEEKYPEAEAFIKSGHPYSVPEIVAIKAEKVSGEYRKWLEGYLAESA